MFLSVASRLSLSCSKAFEDPEPFRPPVVMERRRGVMEEEEEEVKRSLGGGGGGGGGYEKVECTLRRLAPPLQ